MLTVIDRGIVFDATTAPLEQRSNAFTSLTATSEGYLCSFRSASGRDDPGGRLRVMSSDDGKTWSTLDEGLIYEIDGIVGDMYAGYFTELEPGLVTGAFVWVDRSNPDLSFVNPETAGILPTRNLLASSTDGGRNWKGWREVDLGPEEGCTLTGPVFEFAEGVLGLPYETWKSYNDTSPGHHTASLRLSRDGGATWNERQVVAADPHGGTLYWDQRIAVNGDSGDACAMFWTHNRPLGRDIDNTIAWLASGQTEWSAPVSCNWPGQHCQPLWLGGDRLLAVHVQRGPQSGIVARLSEDFGHTWNADQTTQIYLHNAFHSEDQAESFEAFWLEMMTWEFGHPRAVQMKDGDVLVVWYAGDSNATSVHWARLSVPPAGEAS